MTPLSTFLVMAASARLMSHEEFGKFVFIQSVGYLLSILGGGVQITQQTLIPAQNTAGSRWLIHRRCREIYLMQLMVVGCVCLIALWAKKLSILNVDVLTPFLSVLMALLIMADQLFGGATRAFQLHTASSRIDLLSRLSQLGVVVVVQPFSALSLIILLVVVQGLVVLTKMQMLSQFSAYSTEAEGQSFVKMDVLRSSIGVTLHQAAGQIFSTADKILVGGMVSYGFLASYAMMQQACSAIQIVPSQLLYPMLSRIAGMPRLAALTELRRGLVIALWFSTGLMLALLLSQSFILPFVFGEANYLVMDSRALSAMAVLYVVMAVQAPLVYYLQGIGRSAFVGGVFFFAALGSVWLFMTYQGEDISQIEAVLLRSVYALGVIPSAWVVFSSVRGKAI
jgi:O-antigen/teichoic acid export membrane protein